MIAVFTNKKGNHYIKIGDTFYNVYVDKDVKIEEKEGKNGGKYFLANLMLKKYKNREDFYFVAIHKDNELVKL